MGHVDKGLVLFNERPMVASVIDRLRPQVNELLINANQNLDSYGRLGFRVIPDAINGFAGPLAGLERGLAEAANEWIVTCPCDSPFLPLDLVARLKSARDEQSADLAVAKTGNQAHPVFCLVGRSVHEHLREFLLGGGRKIDAWYATLKIVEVSFDDEAEGFVNINTTDELKNLERRS